MAAFKYSWAGRQHDTGLRCIQEVTWMASVDDQEKQSSKSWLRHVLESALIALNRPAGFLVPVGAAVVCVAATSSFLDAFLLHQAESAVLGDWASRFPWSAHE